MDKTVKIPGPDHPITITPAGARVTVRLKDTVWPGFVAYRR
jgi:hypothetical protein